MGLEGMYGIYRRTNKTIQSYSTTKNMWNMKLEAENQLLPRESPKSSLELFHLSYCSGTILLLPLFFITPLFRCQS